jgi:putative chitinase
MVITNSQLKQILSTNDKTDEWVHICNTFLPRYGINNVNRIASFLAQTGHESLDFTVLKENLNYSMSGLRRTFRKYFPTDALAKEYARQPTKIANRVYANRMGNGSEASGDGWKYRGKGLIQLTGKSNHEEFAKSKNMSLDEVIDYLLTKEGAFESACWFWNKRNLNPLADAANTTQITKLINGGHNGLGDRLARFTKAKKILSVSSTPVTEASTVILKLGSRGDEVKKLQKALGITDDGVFGLQTSATLMQWQRNNGLKADGIAGPATLGKLYK